MPEIEEIAVTEMNDSGRVLDNVANEWVLGWQNLFRRQTSVVLFTDKVLNVNNQVENSAAFYSAPYRQFSIFLDIRKTGSGGTLYLYPQFSLNGSDWYFDVASGGANNSASPGNMPVLWRYSVFDFPPSPYFRLRIKGDAVSPDEIIVSATLFADSW